MALNSTPRSARFAQFMHDTNSPRQSQANAAEPEEYSPTPISQERIEAIRNAPTAQPAGVPTDSPFYDHAKNILTPAPITQDQKADAYDHYHLAKTPAELSTRLQGLNLPADLHGALVNAKTSSMPVKSHADKVMDGINRMTAINPRDLEIAESHPKLLAAFLAGNE